MESEEAMNYDKEAAYEEKEDSDEQIATSVFG